MTIIMNANVQHGEARVPDVDRVQGLDLPKILVARVTRTEGTVFSA